MNIDARIATAFLTALFHMSGVQASECADLAKLKLVHTEIALAESVPAGGFKAPAGMGGPGGPGADFSRLPAFCRVAGTSRPSPDSDIRFEVWLPLENWNGKI